VFVLLPFVNAATSPIPEVVNITVLSRVEARRLELLVRVPLAAIKDIQLPTRGDADTLDLPMLKSMLPGAAKYWVARAFEVSDKGQALPVPQVADTRVSISGDQSFDSYRSAASHFGDPELPADEQLFWQQTWFDIRFLYELPAGEPRVVVTPRVAGLGVRVSTRLTAIGAAGRSHTFSFDGDPGPIDLEPYTVDTLTQFVLRGARFVAGSADILLLLFCLVLPFRRYRQFSPVLISFAAALVVALTLVAAGATPRTVWFGPLVEVVATICILLAALANIVGRVTPRRRALFGLGAGAVFGFFTAAALEPQLQFGGTHIAAAELAFGAGVVLAVTLVVGLLLPVTVLLFSFARVEPLERVIVSALAADTSWSWLVDRWALFRKVPLEPNFDATMTASALQTLAVVVLIGGAVWFVSEWLKSLRFTDEEVAPRQSQEPAP
jgi:hypothetical protein